METGPGPDAPQLLKSDWKRESGKKWECNYSRTRAVFNLTHISHMENGRDFCRRRIGCFELTQVPPLAWEIPLTCILLGAVRFRRSESSADSITRGVPATDPT